MHPLHVQTTFFDRLTILIILDGSICVYQVAFLMWPQHAYPHRKRLLLAFKECQTLEMMSKIESAALLPVVL
jgi:hypothetical protein